MIFRNVELYNVQEVLECTDRSGYQLSRVPERVRSRLNRNAQGAALSTSGCEIRFNMAGDRVKLVLQRDQVPQTGAFGVAEVYYGPFQGHYWLCPFAIGTEPSEIIIEKPDNLDKLARLAKEQQLPYDPHMIRVILPYDLPHILVDIEGDTTPPQSGQSPSRRYLAYGSSITHGGSAVRPTGSYAMRLAQKLEADLINLGFAGSAELDEAAADYIAERQDWTFATIELGINVIDKWDTETFERKVHAFLGKVGPSHKEKWIFCTDLFMNEKDLEGNPKVKQFRDIVRLAVEKLDLPKLIYVPGDELLTCMTGLSADLVHPSEQGFEEIAGRLASIMKERIGEAAEK
jgi:hypothetical protein